MFKKDVRPQVMDGRFSGYAQSQPAAADEEIARIGPGTPAGEYYRRFWHPVYTTEELGELPEAIRILGEDLVLFRYGEQRDRIGLVHKHCLHRRASLEYGKCEDNGIRCCYHGWLFAPDGEILEMPAESSKTADMLRKTARLGAYPVIEYRGLIFAYMGPPDDQPDFPIYDACLYEDMTSAVYKAPYRCNWIQILDAILDPTHTTYLHSRNSHPQFSEGMKAEGVLQFYERHENHFLGSATRRVGDNVWVRVNELILPNFTQAGSAFAADGKKQIYFGRSCFTRWVVPVDDENSIVYAWANFGSRWDPHQYNTREGYEMIEQGEVIDRSLEDKKRFPADSEAVEGMGGISTHKGENLMPTDRGIALYRRRIRKQVRALADQINPPQPTRSGGNFVKTYGQDTVLALPARSGEDDQAYLDRIGKAVMDLQFAAEAANEESRDDEIIDRLKDLEVHGIDRTESFQ
ncbi:MAG: aromatic ring-hydroxylating dioxygenase subunit alpha [Acidiferrobacterales bacterium]|nr:aromatic ring-hydroxylating dioxygenase subunit alpha [Acidiferrobacterales bacterium]